MIYWRLEFGEVTEFANGRWGATMWINDHKCQIAMVAQETAAEAESYARQHVANKIEMYKKSGEYQMIPDRLKYNWKQETPALQMVAVNSAIAGLLDNYNEGIYGENNEERQGEN